MKFFVSGTTARTTAELVGIHRNSAIRFFHKIRQNCKQLNKNNYFEGEVELDESYFGGNRKGKRGRGAKDKVPVFGILKRGSLVYTQIIDNTKTDTLMPIIRSKIKPDSIVYTDNYRSYNALDVSEFKHYRVNHISHFVEGSNHINGIENFWNQTKRNLRRYNGISKKHFYLFLKECEWRFNIGSPKALLQDLKNILKGSY